MLPVVFQTKARNLIALQNVLKSARILPLMCTTLDEFKSNEIEVLKKIKSFFGKENVEKLIIRSSSQSEDSTESSNAGAFLSIPNVTLENEEELKQKLMEVGQSMPSVEDEILIQPMLQNITMCGVATSADKDTLAPYDCIEYDKSGSNSSITDGSAKGVSFFSHKEAELPSDSALKSIILMLRELESLFNYEFLDVEWAF